MLQFISNHPFTYFLFRRFILSLICIACHASSEAQQYQDLQSLKGYSFKLYFSSGAETKAARMAKKIDHVMAFYKQQIQFTPDVTLLILSPADWPKYSRDVVYGMPHYTGKQVLIVASENNDFWKSFIPPVDNLLDQLAGMIKKTYVDVNGQISMEPFFDLLAIHELGHAYHFQDSLQMQRKWMSELFVNIFLHNYIAQAEPDKLPALTVFPNMVIAGTNKSDLQYSSLADLEKYYDVIAQRHPRNYGWYQCRWHASAGTIYDRAGPTVFNKAWHAFKRQRDILDDQALAVFLADQVHPSFAEVMKGW
ncbi:MAG TPA: hypothetical protein PKW54_05580 [Ferruginibacter sp.]|nr:hypothetical protein [Ferruginibacter sp.]